METYKGPRGEVTILTRGEQPIARDDYFAPTAAQELAAQRLRDSGEPHIAAFEAQVHEAAVGLPQFVVTGVAVAVQNHQAA